MSDRTALMNAFRTASGWGGAHSSLLAGDASFRKYYRLQLDGQPAVLMDAPPPQEDVRPFIRVARHLTSLGLSAPRILAENAEEGFLLLEDLGDATYTRLLATGHDEKVLYGLAVDVLAALHAHAAPAGVPRYDDDRLIKEAVLLTDWFLPAVGMEVSGHLRETYIGAWLAVLPLAREVPDVLVLRDYHVDNLMIVPNRHGLAACGLLDFQDAVEGPLTYDLMSLLEDARRDIDPALVASMKQRYLAHMPGLDRGDFETSFAVLAAQRHAKVIGIFTRLFKRDRKPQYLPHIPRVWGLLERAVQHPALEPVRLWLDDNVPETTRRRMPS